MNFLRIRETCVYVKDLEKARKFYVGTLELPIISEIAGKHLFLRAGQSVLLLFNPDDSSTKVSPPPHFAAGNQHFAFEVDATNYDEARAEIQAKGVLIIDEVTWKSGKKSFYFNDPEGNVLEILPDQGIWD